MNYKPWEYKRLEWTDLWIVIKGYTNKIEREREERAFYWRETFALMINIAENSPSVSGAEIYPLKGDVLIASKAPSQETIEKMQQLADRMNNGG